MQTTTPIDFRCPSCGYATQAAVTAIVDVAHNPEEKARLLSGTLNTIQCPNCNVPSTAATPLLYHDASKELLITLVPMGLGLSEQETDAFIGTLMKQVMNGMDQKMVKGYIFQPRRAMTMQGLVEQVLEGDGVTREMQAEQQERARLVQMFLQTDPDTLDSLVQEHDDKIDEQFFTMMSVAAQQTAQQGRPDIAEHILMVQERIATLSTAGQTLIEQAENQQVILEEVATQLQSLGSQPTPTDVVEVVLPYATDEERLQAFVGLARPIFDYRFFEALTEIINDASADDREMLEHLRETILRLTQVMDQQQQAEMQEAVSVLRDVVNAPDPEAAIRENLGRIDETFMALLELNIQEAEKQGEVAASARMKTIRDRLMEILQENMRPDVRFINDLLSAESESVARQMVRDQAVDFGVELLDTFDALIEVIGAQGQQEIVGRLTLLKQEAQNVFAS
jgi:hypothetical protein